MRCSRSLTLSSFEEFFETPIQDSAAPHALGFDGFFREAFSYHWHNNYWTPFDRARDWPDLGPRFIENEMRARTASAESLGDAVEESAMYDRRDLDWGTAIKRTFEAYIRGERPNMYGEWIQW